MFTCMHVCVYTCMCVCDSTPHTIYLDTIHSPLLLLVFNIAALSPLRAIPMVWSGIMF